MSEPLAYKLRPTSLDDVVGQDHLVGKNKIIYKMVKSKKVSSMILYGPPAIGKTTIAMVISNLTGYELCVLNAAQHGKKDLESVTKKAEKENKSILLMLDEIHRLTKVNQDYLLPFLEKGTIILVGATTENPYLSLTPALRSRVRLFELNPLSSEDVLSILNFALSDKENGYGGKIIHIDEKSLIKLSESVNGDVRSALDSLELAIESSDIIDDEITISHDYLMSCVQTKNVTFDSQESHYNLISALQKSIRGSDVDASLFYASQLLLAGELDSVCRRVGICAYEDIGIANPELVQRAITALNFAQQVGMPEARIPISNAIVELANSPKSNSAYKAIKRAMDDVESGKGRKIPNHIKDGHYKGAKKMGVTGYKYPFEYQKNVVKQQYLPDDLIKANYLIFDDEMGEEVNISSQNNKLRKFLKTFKKKNKK